MACNHPQSRATLEPKPKKVRIGAGFVHFTTEGRSHLRLERRSPLISTRDKPQPCQRQLGHFQEKTLPILQFVTKALKPEDAANIELGNNVWWHGNGWGQAGTVDGHKFYRGREYIGRLGADVNVYDADDIR